MAATMTADTKSTLVREEETARSMKAIVFRQFLEHRMAVIGAIMIILLVATALAAPLISIVTGLDPDEQNVSARYLLPGERAIVSSGERESDIENWITANPDLAPALQSELIAKGAVPGPDSEALYQLAQKDPTEARADLKSLQSPGAAQIRDITQTWDVLHVFGTDEIGRDVMIRLIYGARVSIGVGILVALISGLVGFLVGAFAGFYGGFIDAALMRVTDALLSLPQIPVLIVFAAIDIQKIPWLAALISGPNESIFKMTIILGLFSWMTVARLVRGSILSLRERDFIMAARTLGARDRTIIGRHMFPNVIAPMLVSITLGVGESILGEAALSFLGLGIQPPMASWGNMLNNAQEVIYQNMWLAILPGTLILITVMSFNFLGDGLQDAMDPKAIRR